MFTSPADDQLATLGRVVRGLDAAGVPYMVSGSLAMSYYAQPRMTRDIDIVVELEEWQIDRVFEEFSHDFFCERDGLVRAVRSQRMVNLIHLTSLVKVDLIVRKESAYRRLEFQRRVQHDLGSLPVWLVSPEDLVLSKLEWAKHSGSELQLRDVRNLLESVAHLDWEYLDHWAGILGLAAMLGDVRP